MAQYIAIDEDGEPFVTYNLDVVDAINAGDTGYTVYKLADIPHLDDSAVLPEDDEEDEG